MYVFMYVPVWYRLPVRGESISAVKLTPARALGMMMMTMMTMIMMMMPGKKSRAEQEERDEREEMFIRVASKHT